MKHNFSFEEPAEYITVGNEPSFLKLRNKIQKDLMGEYSSEFEKNNPEKFYGLSDDNKIELRRSLMSKWAELYSKKFGEIFHRAIIANPHFLEDLESLPDTEFGILKEELYLCTDTLNVDEIEEGLELLGRQ